MDVPIGDIASGGGSNAELFTLIGVIFSAVLGTITSIVVTLINRKPPTPNEEYVQFLEHRLQLIAAREEAQDESSGN